MCKNELSLSTMILLGDSGQSVVYVFKTCTKYIGMFFRSRPIQIDIKKFLKKVLQKGPHNNYLV